MPPCRVLRAILACAAFWAAWAPSVGSDTAPDASGEENCDSGYWRKVQRALAETAEPSASLVAQLVAEEGRLESLADGAGCDVGRFVLSVWMLVHADVADRVEHLRQRFGLGFYALEWRIRSDWHVFNALAKLRQRVREDPEDTYLANGCDELASRGGGGAETNEAESRLLAELSVLRASAHADVALATAAAHFLYRVDQSSACPLAVGAAFWALALSMVGGRRGTVGGDVHEGRSAVEVQALIRQGETSAKSWGVRRMPFTDLLTTHWPLWELAAELEGALGTPRRAQPETPLLPTVHDPLNPRCAAPDRRSFVEGLHDQRVEAVVVYGRRDRVEILHRYLLRNARANGGVLDHVMFVVFAVMEEDLVYLRHLVQEHAPYYSVPPVSGRRLAKMYSVCTDPDTVYVKIDDDVVYISDEAIPSMVRERLRGRCSFVSANVVNHAILSSLHQDIGAIRTFYQVDRDEDGEAGHGSSRRPWIRLDDEPPMMPILRQAQSDCVWKRWECAAWMHESFLSRLNDGTACAYDFGWHDFHAHGHGVYQGERFLPLPYTRWSINMIAFKAEDLQEASLPDLAEDDESELSYMVPYRMGKRGCAVGQAIVAHFSYSTQDEGLIANTDLLQRYHELSLSRGLMETGS